MHRQLAQMKLLTLALLVSPIAAYTQDPSSIRQDLIAPPAQAARVKFVLHGVKFGPTDARVRPDTAAVLDEAVQLVGREQGTVTVAEEQVEPVGSDAFNCALARRRARSVKGYLVGQGIAANRIVIDSPNQSCGGISDMADTAAQNPRIELRLE